MDSQLDQLLLWILKTYARQMETDRLVDPCDYIILATYFMD